MKGVLEDTGESDDGFKRRVRGFEGGVASKRPSEASPDQNPDPDE